jgi:chromosomal replication initiation ATPase DnaA
VDFIDCIKKEYLSDKADDKEIPALKDLSDDITTSDIITEVETEFKNEGPLKRNITIFLLKKYTRTKLKDIGALFGIVESGVSKVCQRFSKKIEEDDSLRKRLRKIELKLSKVKT